MKGQSGKKHILALLTMAAILTALLSLAGCNNAMENKTDKNIAPAQNALNQKPTIEKHVAYNGKALNNQGDLAFILKGKLYIFQGQTGQLFKIYDNGLPLSPRWSADGKYLAFVTVTDQDNMEGSLWLASNDGTNLRKVKSLAGPVYHESYSWSPQENILAVCAKGGTYLVNTKAEVHQLVKSKDYMSVVWSPDGKSLAYSQTLPYDMDRPELRDDALYTIDVGSGKTTKRLVADDAGIDIAGWWQDGKGILYWLDPCHSASIRADGLDLYSLKLGQTKAVKLPNGLTDPEYLAQFNSDQIIMVTGSGREISTNKRLAMVNYKTGAVAKLPQPPGSVVSDIAVSMDASHLAYIAAKDLGGNFDFSQNGGVEKWFDTYALWAARADGSTARRLSAAGTGISQPQWSKDGKHIMYCKKGQLWIIDAEGKQPEKIVDLSGGDEDSKSIYAKVPITSLFSWYK